MHAVIYGKFNIVAYKILGFETREGKLGLSIESGGCLPQKAWVQIVKGLKVKPIDKLEAASFLPHDERKGGHNRTRIRTRKRLSQRIYHCRNCGEAKLLPGHKCFCRQIEGVEEGV